MIRFMFAIHPRWVKVNYQKFIPPIQLAPFIESIWTHEDLNQTANQDYPPTRVLPTTGMEAIFHYGDPYVRVVDGKQVSVPRSSFSGQKTEPADFMAAGQTGIILIRFKPWGAAAFFKDSLAELADQSIDLKLLARAATISVLEEKLQETNHSQDRVNLIQEFFLSLLNTSEPDRLIQQAALRIKYVQPHPAIPQIAAEVGLSKRQFDRRFKRAIGLGPKQFSMIVRFQSAIAHRQNGLDWSDIVFQCGYYDQAHLIKEFNHLSGFSPQNFLTIPTRPLARYYNTPSNMSRFYNTIYL